MRAASRNVWFTISAVVAVAVSTLSGGLPSSFWAVGEAVESGMLVGEMGYARWDFMGISPSPQQLVLQLSIWAQGGGDELPVCLRLSTPALGDWRLYRLRLRRISRGTIGWLYFGQLCISRRDLALGSSLSVRLDPAVPDVRLWVDRTSVALLTGEGDGPVISGVKVGEYAGWQAPTPPLAGVPRPINPSRPSPSTLPPGEPRQLPDTERFQDAAFLAPGLYRGEIGWPGPGVDMNDWYKMNLRPGQTLRVALAVADGGRCGLAIYNARGERVASSKAGCELALEYLAETSGPWYLQISCPQLGQVVTYTLEIGITG